MHIKMFAHGQIEREPASEGAHEKHSKSSDEKKLNNEQFWCCIFPSSTKKINFNESEPLNASKSIENT